MARLDSAQRATILEAAIPVFAAQGLDGASIRAITKGAGVNSALMYYYFEDKRTLFVEALRFVVRGMVDHLGQSARDFASGRERLSFLVNGVLDYFEAHPDRLKLVGVATILHADLLGQVMQGLVAEQIPLPITVLRAGMERGELRAGHPVQAWWSILGVCLYGLQIREVAKHLDPARLPMPLPTMAEKREQIISLFCDGLATPRPATAAKTKKAQR